jgi:glycosyltransferase involved in cell wall biosynthesis
MPPLLDFRLDKNSQSWGRSRTGDAARRIPPAVPSGWSARTAVWEYLVLNWRPYFFSGLASAVIAPLLGGDLTDLGHLSHAALARQLAGARAALVTPRWEEPFGLVVAEALACGTPVAAFHRGALPDILDAECGRLARADDPSDLARAIGEAVTLDRRACRARAEALFDADAMTDRYEALYREVLARTVRSRGLRETRVHDRRDAAGA